MGIFGLTSYISKNESEFLKHHKLHDCSILIDGNAAASLIYSHYTKCIHAFGGDYDKFAYCIKEFIELLKKCNIYACFIFDGGYEKRKLKTVIDRLKLNIAICSQFKNKYRESKCFPLLLRDVFKDVLRSLNVPVIQCDFEADQELVVLARILNCPVISNDSDFYINNVSYIPFSSLELKAYRWSKKIKDRYYMQCKIYQVDDLLNKFEGLPDKSLLPLMSCVLGNDYIPPHTFKHFLGIGHSIKLSKRMEKVIRWLRGVISADDAVNELVSYAPKKLKGGYRKLIKQLLYDFNSRSSQLLEHIPEAFYIHCELSDAMNNLIINGDDVDSSQNISHSDFEISRVAEDEVFIGVGEDSLLESHEGIEIIDSCEYEIEYNDEDELEEDSSINTSNFLDSSSISNNPTSAINLPEWVVRKFRSGLLSPNVMNIYNFKRIIIQSQSEDYSSPPSHSIIIPILEIIVALILGEKKSSEVKLHARLKSIMPGIYKLKPVFSIDSDVRIPSLKDIADMSAIERQTIILKSLNIEDNMNLNSIPEEWRIFVISVFYWLKNCTGVNQTFIRSVILCLIYLSVIDKKIGYVRTQQDLNTLSNIEKKKKPESVDESPENAVTENTPCFDYLNNSEIIIVSEIVNLVSQKDCITAACALLHYHHLDSSLLQNRKMFNTKIVHVYAQFQHCLQTVGLLNSLLDFPFMPCMMQDTFSGTFLYNFYTDMFKRKLADGYITRTLLSKATDIITLYKYLMKFITSVSSNIVDTGCSNSEKKKKRSKAKNITKSLQRNEIEEKKQESFIDAENIYSLLSTNDCDN